MVLAAAGAAHGNGAFGPIEDDRDVGQVESRGEVSKLRLELLDELRYFCRDDVQYRIQPFIAVVRANTLSRSLTLSLRRLWSLSSRASSSFGARFSRNRLMRPTTRAAALLRVPIWAITSLAAIAAESSASLSL